jgi:hypothetical protein
MNWSEFSGLFPNRNSTGKTVDFPVSGLPPYGATGTENNPLPEMEDKNGAA